MSAMSDEEAIDRAEKIAGKLSSIEQSPAYINAMLAMSQYQKDNFEMIDRSLSMMQAVHSAELKNNEFYVDVIKFLAPIFATAAITGAAVNTPGVNSTALFIIGCAGLGVSIILLVPLLIQRHKKAKRQNKEYEKLSDAFSGWKKVADLKKMMDDNPEFNAKESRDLLQDIVSFADMMEERK